MNRPGQFGNQAVVAALAAPVTNWGQIMAGKDQQLQQQSVLTQQAENELLQEQQAAAQVAAFQAKLQSLPLERPDKLRVEGWLSKQKKALEKRLAEEYEGNVTRFIQSEGPAWQEATIAALQNSAEYSQGLRNLEEISKAKAAQAKGESLVGNFTNVGGKPVYTSADQQLMDYYSGTAPTFAFRGSYKDDDALVKHFGEQYAPGQLPYQRTAVADADIQNYLAATNSPEVAMDKYFRKYSKAQVFYKTKPLDDQEEFLRKREEFSMKKEDRVKTNALKDAQLVGVGLSNQLKAKKLAGTTDEGSNDDYLQRMLQQSVDEQPILFEPGGNKKLAHSGYDLNTFATQGPGGAKASFKALTIYDKQAQEGLGSLVGAEKTKDGWRGGSVLEGVVDGPGFHPLDLAGTKHQIVRIEPKLYTNPKDFDARGQPASLNGPEGFLKVRVKFDTDADAKKSGLTEGWLFDTVSKRGTGTYDKANREVTIYTPVGSLTKNKALSRFLSKQDAGPKLTNDFMSPWTLGTDDDD